MNWESAPEKRAAGEFGPVEVQNSRSLDGNSSFFLFPAQGCVGTQREIALEEMNFMWDKLKNQTEGSDPCPEGVAAKAKNWRDLG